MRQSSLVMLLLLANACATSRAVRSTPPAVPPALLQTDPALEKQRARYSDALPPSARPTVDRIEVEFMRRLGSYTSPDETEGVAHGAAGAILGADAGADIEALCFIVLMDASKSAEDDLQSIMGAVNAIQAAAACDHDLPCLKKLVLPQYAAPSQLASIVARAAQPRDALSELGETESLRLQMAMDRRSKLMTTLSNLLKKIQDTDTAILQNLK